MCCYNYNCNLNHIKGIKMDINQLKRYIILGVKTVSDLAKLVRGCK